MLEMQVHNPNAAEQIGEPELARLSVFQTRFHRSRCLACQRQRVGPPTRLLQTFCMENIVMKPGVVLLSVVLLFSGCQPGSSGARLSETDVLKIAEPAMAKRFPESYPKHKPYHAELKDGIWTIRGTLPPDVVGGTPEATVRDSDGKLVEVFHTQ